MERSLEKEEWFASWFDTEWYHILYKDRDLKEAKQFISRLVEELALPISSRLLDAACGAGRHSLQLNSYGYKVHGFDLSTESINKAKAYENPNLEFSVADLRTFSSKDSFDAIFSFFTSFGYFENHSDSIDVLNSFRKVLAPGGIVLIDFMNSSKNIANLVSSEVKSVDEIDFKITREVLDSRIVKSIEFEDKGKKHSFYEKVSAYTLEDFENMLDEAGLAIKKLYGSYLLDDFSEDSSSRLIILAEQKS